MGQSLRSVMEEEDELLSEKAVLQLASRIVSVNLLFFQTTFNLQVIVEVVFYLSHHKMHRKLISFSLQIDALQYIHSNEYVHADINAENIYIKPGQKSQVRK